MDTTFFNLAGVHKMFLLVWTTSVLLASKLYAEQTSHVAGSGYFFYQQSEYPRDCKEVFDQCLSSNISSGVYYIRPEGFLEPFEVYCDSDGDTGGWTVIQERHTNGSVSFKRDWESYKHGFGFPSLEFWIGNEKLAFLTSQKAYQLLIEITLSDGSSSMLTYNNFRISDAVSEYKLVRLSLDSYRGESDHITWCDDSLHYGNCTCGKRTCENPDGCIDTCAVGLPDYCVPCPDGYYMKEGDCVPQSQCGCYVSEDRTVIPEGGAYINNNCTRRYVCSEGQLQFDGHRCSGDAVCKELNNVRGCYCEDGYSGDNITCLPQGAVRDCQDLYDAGIQDNGIYNVLPTNWPGLAFPVYCNMTSEGGWTVFQRRVDGTQEFYLDWASYKRGFGDPSHEFWIGNDKLYYLTNQREYQIRVDLVHRDGGPYYAKYDAFRISNENDNYRLTKLGKFGGTAGDGLQYYRNQQFSTRDRDNDAYSGYHCAQYYHGAWWYNNCYYSLNGDYNATRDSYTSIYWYNLPGSDYNIKYTEMKIRPA